ncbi:MAG: DUF1992 domain-containing protein [Ectothiorhodospiraceae bacterium]|nr:DUF1992 domain-containing protein [Chromatiales bacterium]MCP5153636.1 DUF1992 domain-containing protein [Ectothiorhodospiraceae bacterium]
MLCLDRIAEERIAEAIARGELDDLPGMGRPLELDDDSQVPAELRAAYRVLRNAGFVPEEVRIRRELAELGALVSALEEGGDRVRAMRKLDLLRARLSATRRGAETIGLDDAYTRKVVDSLARDPRAGG